MRKLIILTGTLGVLLQFFYAARLPERVANHFGSGGHANSWMSNQANLLFSIFMLALISGVFLSIPVILRKSPVSIINFPKKAYWLAPERKSETIPVITNWLQFMGVATNLFLLIIFHLVYRANFKTPAHLNEGLFLTVLVSYLVIVLCWLLALFRKFNKIKE